MKSLKREGAGVKRGGGSRASNGPKCRVLVGSSKELPFYTKFLQRYLLAKRGTDPLDHICTWCTHLFTPIADVTQYRTRM